MAAFDVSEQEMSGEEVASARSVWTRSELLAGRRSRYLEVQHVWARYYRSSLTFVPRGFSSTSREKGIHRPPAFSTFTSARGENLNATIVNFSLGRPEPSTLPGTATTSPSFTCLETWPRFRTTLVL